MREILMRIPLVKWILWLVPINRIYKLCNAVNYKKYTEFYSQEEEKI